MKKIEDYIDKEVGINCSNKKEFDDIIKLINIVKIKASSTLDYCSKSRYILNLNNIIPNSSNNIGVGSLTDYIDYTIYPASDFLTEEIPEYVEWINHRGSGGTGFMCSISHFKKGKIFCTKTDDIPPCGLNNDMSNWTEVLNREWYQHAFVSATKEAYDAQNQPKFKIGKWYKISNNWYAKFLTIHGSGTYWRFSERITSNHEYNNTSSNLNMSEINNGVKIKLLTDLSEIQQYLPEGHVDKIKKSLEINDLVANKIYFGHCYSRNYIFKAYSGFHIKEHLDLEYKSFLRSGDFDKQLKNIRLATKEEEHQLNCSIKANKFVSLEDSKKIKLDDNIVPEYVECIKKDNGIEINQIYNVDKFKDFIYGNLKEPVYFFKNGPTSPYYQSYFKPSTKAAFDLQQKELLLEEAKRRYPVGTKYYYVDNPVKEISIITGDLMFTEYDTICGVNWGKPSVTKNDCNVYVDGRWAEIVEQPKEVKQDEFVLPEFWYIEVNEKSLNIINKHRLNTDFPVPIKLNEWKYYGISSNNWDIVQCYNTIPKDAVKITLEQFKKYVIKESLAERLMSLQQAVESVRCDIEHNFQLAGFNGGIFQLKHEVKSIIKPINKIELNLKKTAIKPVVKQRKQLTIIKTKQLKLN